MTPKKIWGVIIIVVGIFMIFNGATKSYEAEFFGNEIMSMERQISNYGGSNFSNSRKYQKLIEQEKNNGLAGVLLGISMAIGGTLLLRDKRNTITTKTKDDNKKRDGDWSF